MNEDQIKVGDRICNGCLYDGEHCENPKPCDSDKNGYCTGYIKQKRGGDYANRN